jgi:ankyrin repeat protein
LQGAAYHGYTNVVALLLTSKADVNPKNNQSETPLHMAAMKGDKDVTELLLANGADVNAKDTNGATPLQVAALNGNKDMIELLLTNKADVNAKTNDGSTPLHEAIWALGHAKQHVVGQKPLSPLEISKYSDVVELLCQHGGHE